MTAVKASPGFSLTSKCTRCKSQEVQLDALKAAGAKVERELRVGGGSGITLRCPELPCPNCGNETYTVKFSLR